MEAGCIGFLWGFILPRRHEVHEGIFVSRKDAKAQRKARMDFPFVIISISDC